MSSKKMNAKLKKLVADEYPAGKRDLYAAFIQRCIEFAGETGRVGMLTMHSFMFISSYENLRSGIRDNLRIETLVHTGPALFAVGNPGTLQTAAYVFCREEDEKARNDSVGTYFRLVKEPDSEAKQRRFEQAVANLRLSAVSETAQADAGRDDSIVYHYRQSDFDAIPGNPWVYWITPGLRKVFETFPKLGEIAQPKHGMTTGDNFRFLRFWWEPGIERIGFGSRNAEEALQTGKRWFLHMKGGSFRKWYGNHEYVVNYKENGQEMIIGRECGSVPGFRHDNPDYYFRAGVTWSSLSSTSLSVRIMRAGFIIGHKGPGIYSDSQETLLSVLAVLNTKLCQSIQDIINPTIDYNVGPLTLMPMVQGSRFLISLSEQAIALAKADSQEDETTWDFIAPPVWPDGIRKVAERHARLAEIEREIDEEVYRLYGISEEDRRAIESELAEPAEAGSEDIEEGEPS